MFVVFRNSNVVPINLSSSTGMTSKTVFQINFNSNCVVGTNPVSKPYDKYHKHVVDMVQTRKKALYGCVYCGLQSIICTGERLCICTGERTFKRQIRIIR